MALQPTKGMLTGGSSYPTKRLPGETDPFDPNAGATTSSFGNFEEPRTYFPQPNNDRPIITDPQFIEFIERTLREEEYQRFIRDNFLRSDETEEDPRGPAPEVNIDEDVFQMILDSILGRANDIPPEILGDDSRLRSYILEELPIIYQESVANAQEIADVLSSGDIASLEDMETPDPLTLMVLEQGGLQFAGAAATTPTTTVGGREVIRGGAGVTVNVKDIVESGNYQDILDAIVPYIPGVSLPNWLPTAGVIFLPSVGEAINKVNEIAGSIGDEIENGETLGEILSGIGQVIVGAGGDAIEEVQGRISDIIGQVTGAITDPTKAGSVLGGIIGTAFPSIPSWLPPLIFDPRVYGAVRSVLTQNFNTPDDQFPPISEEIETDPTLMFTNRGDNYFVSSEADEYFQLAESEDLDFELNGQYTREQLENTGLETIGSGTYQSLLDDLSFHALEEDIYEYSLEDLRTRYEEEGGIIPGDWKEMDDESKYNFLLDDYFEIPPLIEDPDKGEGPTEPEPTPTPTPEPEPTPTPEPADDSVFSEEQESVIRDLFADIIGEASLATTADITAGVAEALTNAGIIDAEGNVIRADVQQSVIAALTEAGIVDENGDFVQQVLPDVQAEVTTVLTNAGIIDTEGNIIRPDMQSEISTALTNAGIIDADGNVIRADMQSEVLLALQNAGMVDSEGNVIVQEMPDVQSSVTAALTAAGIVDEEGNVIRQEAPDIEGGVLSALQTVGLVDEQGQLTLDVTGDVLLALQNAGVVDVDGNVVQQDITNQFLTTLQSVGLVDEEGNVIRQELPDIPAAVISALQTVGLVDNNGNLTTDVSGDVLLTLQNSGIVDEEGNVIRQDISGELLTTLQNAGIVDSEGNVVREELPNFQTELGLALQTAGIVDEEGLSLLATSEDLSSLRDQLVNAGLIGENVTVASQADLDSLITALTDSGLLGEETLFATTSNINDLRDDLTAAGLIGENADVATSSDIASLRGELVAVGLLGDDAIQLASAEDFINELGDYQFTDAQIEQISNAINIPENLSEEQIKQLFTDANLSTSTNVSDAVTSITNAIDALDIPNLEDIKTALSEYGFSEAQLDQIAGAIDIPANLSGEDITQLFTDAGLSTATNVSDAVTTITNAISNLDIDKTVRTALSEFNFTEDQLDQISGAIDIPPNLSGEEVTQLFANAELATATNVTDAVSAINTSLGELGFATPDDVKDILSNYEFTDSQIEQIVGAIPAGLSLTDVDTVVDNALVGVATGENLTDATTTITNAISGLSFATDTDVRTALSEFNFTENQLNQISALMPDTLTGNELTLALNASLENTPTNADLTTVYDNLVTNLTTGFSAITGEDGVLERQDALLSAISGEGGVLEGQQDILTGQEGLLTSQQQIRELVGEETQTLQDMFVGGVGGLLGAMAAGQTPAAPAPREFTPFKETFEYAPTTVETLQAKPQVDYNKEVNRLLTMGMGGRKSGMLV